MSTIVKHIYSPLGEGTPVDPRVNRQGSLVVADQYLQWVLEGRVFGANAGTGTSPITFAGVYDANGMDYHIHVPFGTTIIPVSISVNYDAVGTETTMEIIGLASNTGDPSVTGTASVIYPLRVDGIRASACTVTGAVNAGGVTDPNAGNFIEFWHESRPLTDTVVSGENDRIGLVFNWSARTSVPPVIVGGSAEGSSLSVYAASNAGTGFITVIWAEFPTGDIT